MAGVPDLERNQNKNSSGPLWRPGEACEELLGLGEFLEGLKRRLPALKLLGPRVTLPDRLPVGPVRTFPTLVLASAELQ